MRWYIFLIAAVLWAIIIFTAKAFAHDAGGWNYPIECCHDADCHPVECSSITQIPHGAKQDELSYNDSMVRKSPDGKCHACFSTYPQIRVPHCLFIAFPGS